MSNGNVALRVGIHFIKDFREGVPLMTISFQDFVSGLENKLLRSLTEREWEFTCWMYEQYQKDERSF